MKYDINPDSLFKHISDNKLPPVDSWDPTFCGKIAIHIDRNGQWNYNNSPFTRTPLVKLFAKVLKREQDDYFLVTPVEKVQITVALEPFITVSMEKKNSGHPEIAFKTNLDEIVIAGKEHPIKVIIDDNGQPYPTILIRNNLHALISRSDFYDLVELATSETIADSKSDSVTTVCSIESNGTTFVLGEY